MAPVQPSLPLNGFGTLGFTAQLGRVPDERAFSVLKAAIERGATIWSTATSYGMPPDPPTAGLELLARYFRKYPEDAPKVTLYVRGCFNGLTSKPACTRAEVRADIEEVLSIFGNAKSIDVFGPARIDQNVPVEETIGAMKELVEEGKIGAIGLSEVRAETIRRAAKIHPIKFSEVEFSLWCPEMLENGVALAAKECNVALLAYAPLSYGLLTGHVKSLDEIPEGDRRHRRGRFQRETFDKNLELVDKVKSLAAKKGVTPAQLALAWIRSHSNKGICGAVIPIPGTTSPERVAENYADVELTADEATQLNEIVRTTSVFGHRGIEGRDDLLLT